MYKKQKNFVIIGVAGYIAPKHIAAIKHYSHNLISSYDISQSVGILEKYFPNSNYFNKLIDFNKYIKSQKKIIDYITICSPNYLHYKHIRFSLSNKINVICEKPLVLNLKDLESLEKISLKQNRRIFCILQLRLYEKLINLKKLISKNGNKKYDVEFTYITSRGKWYFNTWKGDEAKSGGIMSNIGIHFFDLLLWIFGPVERSELHVKRKDVCSGFLKLKSANISWFLSTDSKFIKYANSKSNRVYRCMNVDGKNINLDLNFEDLHNKSYKKILNNQGFTIKDVKPSIELVETLRKLKVKKNKSKKHKFIKYL
jgi:UDP-N-acetyl-2-amino-2-deoxyglucuronate dehydrogenase